MADHVPASDASKVVVVPIQIADGPVTVMVGLGRTATLIIGSDAQPAVDVNVNMAVPCATPVMIPALVMVATELLEEAQTPPVVGVTVVVLSIQISSGPVNVTVGLGLIVTVIGVEAQPVLVSVQVNWAVPAEIPVIRPALVIVATPTLLEAQVPPAVGLTVVV